MRINIHTYINLKPRKPKNFHLLDAILQKLTYLTILYIYNSSKNFKKVLVYSLYKIKNNKKFTKLNIYAKNFIYVLFVVR